MTNCPAYSTVKELLNKNYEIISNANQTFITELSKARANVDKAVNDFITAYDILMNCVKNDKNDKAAVIKPIVLMLLYTEYLYFYQDKLYLLRFEKVRSEIEKKKDSKVMIYLKLQDSHKTRLDNFANACATSKEELNSEFWKRFIGNVSGEKSNKKWQNTIQERKTNNAAILYDLIANDLQKSKSLTEKRIYIADLKKALEKYVFFKEMPFTNSQKSDDAIINNYFEKLQFKMENFLKNKNIYVTRNEFEEIKTKTPENERSVLKKDALQIATKLNDDQMISTLKSKTKKQKKENYIIGAEDIIIVEEQFDESTKRTFMILGAAAAAAAALVVAYYGISSVYNYCGGLISWSVSGLVLWTGFSDIVQFCKNVPGQIKTAFTAFKTGNWTLQSLQRMWNYFDFSIILNASSSSIKNFSFGMAKWALIAAMVVTLGCTANHFVFQNDMISTGCNKIYNSINHLISKVQYSVYSFFKTVDKTEVNWVQNEVVLEKTPAENYANILGSNISPDGKSNETIACVISLDNYLNTPGLQQISFMKIEGFRKTCERGNQEANEKFDEVIDTVCNEWTKRIEITNDQNKVDEYRIQSTQPGTDLNYWFTKCNGAESHLTGVLESSENWIRTKKRPGSDSKDSLPTTGGDKSEQEGGGGGGKNDIIVVVGIVLLFGGFFWWWFSGSDESGNNPTLLGIKKYKNLKKKHR